MMDRFKFRVWDKRKNNYIENFVFNIINKFSYITVKYFDNETAYTHTFEEDEIIVEQCTGLRDKNGNLIFEGDIIKTCNTKATVVWSKPNFLLKFGDVLYSFDNFLSDIEVIGKIHESEEFKE